MVDTKAYQDYVPSEVPVKRIPITTSSVVAGGNVAIDLTGFVNKARIKSIKVEASYSTDVFT